MSIKFNEARRKWLDAYPLTRCSICGDALIADKLEGVWALRCRDAMHGEWRDLGFNVTRMRLRRIQAAKAAFDRLPFCKHVAEDVYSVGCRRGRLYTRFGQPVKTDLMETPQRGFYARDKHGNVVPLLEIKE